MANDLDGDDAEYDDEGEVEDAAGKADEEEDEEDGGEYEDDDAEADEEDGGEEYIDDNSDEGAELDRITSQLLSKLGM